MKFSDEVLMAYADGELDDAARAEVEAAMTADPEVRRVVERHRALAARVRAAYQGVLEEPLPAKLASLAGKPVAAPVIELRAEREARRAQRPSMSWSVPQWAAMAASVALGVMIGMFILRGPESPFEETAAGLMARGELDAALTQRLAGDAATGGAQIGISFRDRGGEYCRTFHMQRGTPLAGLACRSGEEWRVHVLAAASSRAGGMRTAAAMPMAVLQAVDAAIAGEPFDATQETAARDTGWQSLR